MDYVFTSDVKVTAQIIEKDFIKEILRWIAFTTEYQMHRIYNDSIKSFSDIRMLKEKDIDDLST